MKKDLNQKILADDVLRYKNNKLGQMLSYVGLVFNCLYIMLLYSFNNNTFYVFEMGVSVLVSLVYLLACFLASEGVKTYNKKFCIFLVVLAAIQIIRIFGFPAAGLKDEAFTTITANKETVGRDYFGATLTTVSAYTLLIVYLVLSSVSLIGAAVWSYLISVRHDKHTKAVESGEIDMDKVMKEIETAEMPVVGNESKAPAAAEEVQ